MQLTTSAAQFRGIVAGIVLGSAAVYLTFHLRNLFSLDPNLVMRAMKAVGVSLVVPGLLAGIASGNVHLFRPWVMSVINFVFWFGFGWLVGVFVDKLIRLRRAIAAAAAPGDRSSSLGSR